MLSLYLLLFHASNCRWRLHHQIGISPSSWNQACPVRKSGRIRVLMIIIIPPQQRQSIGGRFLSQHVAQLLGIPEDAYTPGRMTYDLRRLRLHGIIVRVKGTNRYRVTHEGMRICLFFTKVHHRVIRPGCSQLMDGCPKAPNRAITIAVKQLDRAIDQLVIGAKLAA